MSQFRKMTGVVVILYVACMVYFMLFSFGRVDNVAESSGMTFIFVPDSFFKLPDVADLLPPSLMTLVDIGNIVTCIPVGVLIPMLYRLSFVQFIALFILCIGVIETVQALTLLGSFDINDIIQNSSGAAIGYGASKWGVRGSTLLKKVARTALCVVILLVGTITLCKEIDQLLTPTPGSFIALNEWTDSRGRQVQAAQLAPFKIDGQAICPQFNNYSAEAGQTTTYTYDLGRKEFYLFLNYGIPDSVERRGSISLSVDGQQILFDAAAYQDRAPAAFYWFFEQGKKLTITIKGEEKLWDVGYREMKYFWE